MVAFAGSLRLMEMFSPEELARLVGSGDDSPLAPIPAHLSHAERVALRRARINAIDKAQAATEQATQRPHEAETRGFSRRSGVPRKKMYRADGDDDAATAAWLKQELHQVYRLGSVWLLAEAKAGYARHVWRAAAASMLTRSREDIRSPSYVLAHLATALHEDEIADPRGGDAFTTYEDWPKLLYAFALLRMPERYRYVYE